MRCGTLTMIAASSSCGGTIWPSTMASPTITCAPMPEPTAMTRAIPIVITTAGNARAARLRRLGLPLLVIGALADWNRLRRRRRPFRKRHLQLEHSVGERGRDRLGRDAFRNRDRPRERSVVALGLE